MDNNLESSNPQPTELSVGEYKFKEEKVQTPDGTMLHLQAKGENPRRFAMTIEDNGTLIARIVASGINLVNGDVTVNVDGDELKRSFKSLYGHLVDDLIKDKGIYWVSEENNSPEKVSPGFTHGSLTVRPNEEGVFSHNSGVHATGLMGSQIKIIHEGKVIATTTEAMSIRPYTGTVDIKVNENSKAGKLLINS